MGLETGAFTKAINSISDKLNASKIANNKVFNWKDAGFVGTVGLGAGVGYAASDGDFEQTVNGGIFGVTAAAIGRHGLAGYSEGLAKLAKNSNIGEMSMQKFAPYTTGKMGTAKTLGALGAIGAIGGGLGGALGEQTGAGTTFTGGAIEGGALSMMGASLASIIGHRGGGVTRLLGSGGIGLAAGVGGAVYGGYEGYSAQDGGFQKILIKGAVYGKLAKTAAMLGVERYGSNALNKLPKM